MSHLDRCVVLGSLSLIACLWSADVVEIHLRSGETVTGELTSENQDSIQITTRLVSKSGKTMTGSMAYKRVDIASLIHVEDPEDTYRSRITAAKTANEIADVAVWCREHAMLDHAVDQAQRAVVIDAKQPVALALLHDLGWVLVDTHWQLESAWLTTQGKVRYHGTIMSIVDANALKVQEQQAKDAADAQVAHDSLASRVEGEGRQLVELNKQSEQLTGAIEKNNAALLAAQTLAQKVTTAKAAFDAAENDLSSAQAAAHGQAAGTGSYSASIAQLRIADEKAQRAYLDARDAASGSDRAIAQLQATITAQTADKTRLNKRIEALAAKQKADATTLAVDATPAPTPTTTPAPAASQPPALTPSH